MVGELDVIKAKRQMSRFLKYKWAWILWAVLFAVIEIKAILDDDKDGGDFTLSHFIRRAIGSYKESPKMNTANWAARVAIVALLIWFFPHFKVFLGVFV